MITRKAASVLTAIFAIALISATFSMGPATSSAVAANPNDDTSLADIRRKGKLIVGMDPPYGVMEFYDKSGRLVGIDVDVAREIASRLGVSVEFKKYPFSKLFGALNSGQVDVVISAVTITPERQKKMLFSAPYLDAGMSIAVRQDNNDIKSASDLKGKRIGVLKGTVGQKLIAKSKYVDQSLVKVYEKNDARLDDLRKGKVDAIIVHFLTKNIPSVKIVGKPLSQSFYGVVTRMNNKSLMSEINRILRDLKRRGKLFAIKRQYVGS